MRNYAPLAFRIAAVVNWLVAIGGIVDPTSVAPAFHLTPPNYPFLVRIWTGMVFMFGAMFWEISRDPPGRRRLIKYGWIEKSVTAISVTIAYATAEVPLMMFGLILLTDYFWIAVFLYYDISLRRTAR
ncbi:MAG: hypothetical protein IT168_00220 [Bryobacterales bacterium]|nr:hypothetical protein [Bryobacterales bacterium]